jgi:ribonuclease J
MNNRNNTKKGVESKPTATSSAAKRPARPATTTARPQFNAEPPFQRSLSATANKKPVSSRSSSSYKAKPRTNAPAGRTNTHKPRSTSSAGRGMNARDRQRALRKDMPRIARKQPDDIIPPAGDSVRIIPLGGVEEVGKNMILVEYKDDIIIFDMGFQFVSEEETPGIDYILPNTKYLEDRKDKIRGLVVTHGHLDHIGGIPFIIDKIGNPKIYTRSLTKMMIEKRQTEFPHLPKLDIKVVGPDDNIKLGNLPIKFHPISHSIPDAMAVSVETPLGNIVITGDLKIDHVDEDPTDEEKKVWGDIGKNNNLLLISDSTNAENPGFSITEKKIQQNIEEIIKNIPGRLIIGTFASQFERMIKIVQIAEKYGKKVVTEGRSIKTNIEIAQLAGLLTPKKGTIIPAQDIDKYPANKILVIATGAQGEEFAALMRISTKKHKNIFLNERDTIMLSSSVVPGNETNVQKLKDNLYRHKVHIIHYKVSDIHSTGHGNAGELAWVNKTVNPKFFIPGYGNYSMTTVHAQIMVDNDLMKKENIIVPEANGSIIEIGKDGKTIKTLKEKVPSSIIMVDGLAIGDMQEVVIRDRKMLAQDGMFVIIATIDLKTGRLRKSPDIISRGFIYLRESQELLQETRILIKKNVEETIKGMRPVNFDYVKGNLTEAVSLHLFQKTNKRPLVIPVILSM